ncbi:MAG: hypothetical protein EU544_00705 [Promethearchaeota archaeon]|nr:MAG: hypothetical protein EU544_00705 [Candidatus Lokiarchaeota archaeon]
MKRLNEFFCVAKNKKVSRLKNSIFPNKNKFPLEVSSFKENLNSFPIKNEKSNRIKKQLKQFDWYSIASDWKIKIHPNQYSEEDLILKPFQNCSKANPLYRHKIWLETVYNDKKLNLLDSDIAQLFGVHPSIIGRWRERFSIPLKPRGKGSWTCKRDGRVYIRIEEEDYSHPNLKQFKNANQTYRLEHIYKMEKYLSRHPELEISKKCLIDGKYLKTDCEIHHINFIPNDNRIENLWCYESKKAHACGELTLRDVLRKLIKIDQIGFYNGSYYINKNFDYRTWEYSDLKKKLDRNNSNLPINFKNLENIKKALKSIKWKNDPEFWKVYKYNYRMQTREELKVNPYNDCNEFNPLYMHKEWFSRIYLDNRFKITDSRMGELCGISKDKARYWRDKHNISGRKKWGMDRIVDKSDGRIWIRVPKTYKNPVVNKDDYHRRLMIEHRYLMEKYLANHPELPIAKKCLIDGKYLKSDCEVHHINLDYQDNRLENLWVFENNEEHQKARESLYSLVDKLLEQKLIIFNNGSYSFKH